MAGTFFDSQHALERLKAAAASGNLAPTAVDNIRLWLTDPGYAEFAPEVARHLEAGMWRELDDVFWTVIPFGTGGRRGRMYPIGSNAINDRTIGESAQGLAEYVADYLHSQGRPDQKRTCVIAYDTRHRSDDFARLSAEVMAAAGFTVHLFDGFRSTPELSFAVRHLGCACGIMVTASHNPPSDNAVKVYWSTGGQLVPPHDAGVIDRVMRIEQVRRMPFEEAVERGRIVFCPAAVDAAYVAAVQAQSLAGPRDLNIIYSPLHGVGGTAVLPALAADGFARVELFTLHAEPNGDFPNVPGNVSNPENPAVFDAIIDRARQTGADLVLASDPDCDRIGCAAPVGTDPAGSWATMTGNQIGALLADYLLDQRRTAGALTSDHYLVKTLVTTEMVRRIGDHYCVRTYGDLHVGFKWIGEEIDRRGPDRFVLGVEESHGYLVGQYARDKDAAVAAMLLAGLAAKLKTEGVSLFEKLDALFWQFGLHLEQTVSVTMPGSEGMSRMEALMERLRRHPPTELGGMAVATVRDYDNLTLLRRRSRTGAASAASAAGAAETTSPAAASGDTVWEPALSFDAPRGNMVMIDLAAAGNYIAVRPSGTEPKVKFYLFAYEPPEQLADLRLAKRELQDRLAAIQRDLKTLAEIGHH
jgi:phosphomannomutase